jgi:hypothetical protein
MTAEDEKPHPGLGVRRERFHTCADAGEAAKSSAAATAALSKCMEGGKVLRRLEF